MRGASASPVGTRGGRRPSWTLRSAWGDALWVPLCPCEWRQVFQGTAQDGSVSAFGSLRGYSQLCPLPGLGPISCGRRSWTRWPGPPPGYSALVSDRTSPLLFVSRRHPSQPAEGPEAPGGTAQPIKGRWCPDTSRTRAVPGLFLRESISRGSRSFLPECQAANSATRLETPEPAGASPLRLPPPRGRVLGHTLEHVSFRRRERRMAPARPGKRATSWHSALGASPPRPLPRESKSLPGPETCDTDCVHYAAWADVGAPGEGAGRPRASGSTPTGAPTKAARGKAEPLRVVPLRGGGP